MNIVEAIEKIQNMFPKEFSKFYLEVNMNSDGSRKCKFQVWNPLTQTHVSADTLERLIALLEDKVPQDRIEFILNKRSEELERSAA